MLVNTIGKKLSQSRENPDSSKDSYSLERVCKCRPDYLAKANEEKSSTLMVCECGRV